MSKLWPLWLLALLAAGCAPAEPPPATSFDAAGSAAGGPPDIILIVVDGLRADRLRAELTPFLSSLAARGITFDGARAPAPWTRPTVASVFTGRSTLNHGVLTEADSDRLRSGPTLAQELSAAGYTTLGSAANLHLAEPFGLQAGFDRVSVEHREAGELLDEARSMVDSVSGSPFFLFVFLMDTHQPLKHRPAFDRSSSLPGEAPTLDQLTSATRRRRRGIPDPTAAEIAKTTALYDENVAHVDAELEAFFADLEREGRLDNTVVAITGDHGEALGEHGELFHGWNLYEELVRVPLFLVAPGLEPATVSSQVSLVGLPASLLSLVGLEVPVSFAPPLTLVDLEKPAPVFSHTRFRGAEATSVVQWPYKLVQNHARERLELYALVSDPAEESNIWRERPLVVEALQAEIEGWLERETGFVEGSSIAAEEESEVDPELRRQLEALGYVTDDG